jgi:hypothetical protein
MFPASAFAPRYFPRRYFPEQGATTCPPSRDLVHYARRWRFHHHRQALAYQSRTGADTWASARTICDCLRSAATEGDVSVEGGTLYQELATWHVYKERAGVVIPKVGDRFTDPEDRVWYVDSWKRCDEGWRFQLECHVERE